QLSSWWCVWGRYHVGKLPFGLVSGGKASIHNGIHVSINELKLPSTSSTHAATDHDATTTILDCRQDTIFLVFLTRASPHMLDTI
ncbi:hypothetical protein M9458_052454, partial [Cirrhinus mrigala]